MGGETEAAVSGWTVDTLAAHLRQQINDLNRLLDERAENQKVAMNAALASAEKASSVAQAGYDRRFDSTNEFRAQLEDQARLFMPRSECLALLNALSDRVTRVEERINLGAGQAAGAASAEQLRRAGTQQVMTIISALVAVVSVAVALILGLNT